MLDHAEAWALGFAPGPAPDSAPAPAPGPAAAAEAAQVAQEAPVRGANPVLCMTASGPANCDAPSFGADGVGSLGGPRSDGSSTSASGWNNYGAPPKLALHFSAHTCTEGHELSMHAAWD